MANEISVASSLNAAYRTIFSLGCEREVIALTMSPVIGDESIIFLVKPRYFDYLARTYRLPVTTRHERNGDHRSVEWGGCIFKSVVGTEDTVTTTVAMLPEQEMEI